MRPLATVVVPTYDHGATLRHSVASALRQSVENIEVLIVGDGMPPEAAAVAREVVASDPRVKLFEFKKGARHGELSRHAALAEARGDIFCYLGDDDLLLPNHVETMLELLAQADLAHTLPSKVAVDGSLVPWVCDLRLPYFRQLILSGTNRLPLNAWGHTRAAYRALPHGWRTTPAGTPTDLYMLQQWLRQPNLRASSAGALTALHFASPERTTWTEAQRLSELTSWSKKVQRPDTLQHLGAELVACLSRQAATDEAHYRTQEALLREQLEQTSDYAAGLTRMLSDLGVQVGTSGKS